MKDQTDVASSLLEIKVTITDKMQCILRKICIYIVRKYYFMFVIDVCVSNVNIVPNEENVFLYICVYVCNMVYYLL